MTHRRRLPAAISLHLPTSHAGYIHVTSHVSKLDLTLLLLPETDQWASGNKAWKDTYSLQVLGRPGIAPNSPAAGGRAPGRTTAGPQTSAPTSGQSFPGHGDPQSLAEAHPVGGGEEEPVTAPVPTSTNPSTGRNVCVSLRVIFNVPSHTHLGPSYIHFSFLFTVSSFLVLF